MQISEKDKVLVTYNTKRIVAKVHSSVKEKEIALNNKLNEP